MDYFFVVPKKRIFSLKCSGGENDICKNTVFHYNTNPGAED